MSTVTEYVFTDNGVDSLGRDSSTGNFRFYGNTTGTLRGWFITFPSPIENVTQVDFSALGNDPTDSVSTNLQTGTFRMRAITQESGNVTVTQSITGSGSVLVSALPVITLSNETLTGVAVIGPSSGGANFNMGFIDEGVHTYEITTSVGIEAEMFTHLADLTWTAIGGATNYTVTQAEDGGSEETIVSETTDLSYTTLDLNPGSSYEFSLYSDLDLVTAATSVTESALVVSTANITSLTTRLLNDFTSLSSSSYDELEAELRNFLTTGDEVVLSSGNAIFVENSDAITFSGTDILTPFESTVSGVTQSITLTVGGESVVLAYDESLNQITYDGTAYSVGDSFVVGTYRVAISEI